MLLVLSSPQAVTHLKQQLDSIEWCGCCPSHCTSSTTSQEHPDSSSSWREKWRLRRGPHGRDGHAVCRWPLPCTPMLPLCERVQGPPAPSPEQSDCTMQLQHPSVGRKLVVPVGDAEVIYCGCHDQLPDADPWHTQPLDTSCFCPMYPVPTAPV